MKTSSIVSKKISPYFKGLRSTSEVSAGEGLTIVLVPGDRYSELADAADALGALHAGAERALIVEGNSPDPIKRRLERAVRNHPFCKILYSHHRPTLTEAINMAAVHVTTPYVLFLSGDLRFTAGNAQTLLRSLKAENADLAQPIFNGSRKPIWHSLLQDSRAPFVDPRAFLMKTAAFTRLGSLEERDWRLAGIDLAMTAKSLNLKIISTNEAVIEPHMMSGVFADEDEALKNIQWDLYSSKIALQKIQKKWNLSFSEGHYLQCVMTVRSLNTTSMGEPIRTTERNHNLFIRLYSHLYRLISYARISFISGAALKAGGPRETKK